MVKYISCGKFNKNYIIYFLIYNSTVLILLITLIIIFRFPDEDYYKGININILLMVFLSFFGQSLFIIIEIIINKIILKGKNKEIKKESVRQSTLLITYIFNDLSNKITRKDIIYICFISILFLIIDIFKATISSIKIGDNTNKSIFSEEYYFLELFFLFVLSHFSFKTNYYKHQYLSIIIILIAGLIRYLVKLKYEIEEIYFLFSQIYKRANGIKIFFSI